MDSNNNLMGNNAQNNGNVNVVSSAVNPPLNTPTPPLNAPDPLINPITAPVNNSNPPVNNPQPPLNAPNPPVVKPTNPPFQPPIKSPVKSPKNNKIILASLLFVLLIGLTFGVYKLSGSQFIKRIGEVFVTTQYPSPSPLPPPSNPPPPASPSAPGCTTIKCDWCTNKPYCQERGWVFEDSCGYCSVGGDGCCWPPTHQPGVLTCSADGNGASVTNNSTKTIHVTGNYYAHNCAKNEGCGCGGTPTNIDINLAPGQTQSYGFDNKHDPCAWSWQTDIEITSPESCKDADHGCEVGTCGSASPSPRVSPSLSPTPNLVCKQLSSNVSNLDNVKVGDNVIFTCLGTTTNIAVSHYDYRLSSNNGSSYTTLPHSNPVGPASYAVQSAGNYIVQCRACSSIDTSHCTDWGLASGWKP